MNNFKANFAKGLNRVKQGIEERKAASKSGKMQELSDEMQDIDNEVNATKATYEALMKKCEDVLHGTKMEKDKRIKKMPGIKLAQSMRESAALLADDSFLGRILVDCASAQESVGSLLADFEESVEQHTINPMNSMLKSEIRLVMDSRKTVTRVRSDLETTKQKLLKASDDKVISLDAEFEAVKEQFEIVQAACEEKLLAFASKEAEHADPVIDFMEAQANYYKQASEVLQTAVARLRTQRKHASSPTVFGRPLYEHLANVDRDIPHIVESTIAEIRRKGMTSEGIFRLSGNAATVKRLRAAFNSEQAHVTFEGDPEWDDVEINTVSGVLKLYFRELPEPLLTYDLYREWITAGSNRNHDDKLNAIRDLVSRLPRQNATCLRYLMTFLNELSKNAELTKMHTSNLAIVFGPTLLWSREQDEATAIMETGPQSSVVEALISYADWVFEDISKGRTAASASTGSHSTPPKKLTSPSVNQENVGFGGSSSKNHPHNSNNSSSSNNGNNSSSHNNNNNFNSSHSADNNISSSVSTSNSSIQSFTNSSISNSNSSTAQLIDIDSPRKSLTREAPVPLARPKKNVATADFLTGGEDLLLSNDSSAASSTSIPASTVLVSASPASAVPVSGVSVLPAASTPTAAAATAPSAPGTIRPTSVAPPKRPPAPERSQKSSTSAAASSILSDSVSAPTTPANNRASTELLIHLDDAPASAAASLSAHSDPFLPVPAARPKPKPRPASTVTSIEGVVENPLASGTHGSRGSASGSSLESFTIAPPPSSSTSASTRAVPPRPRRPGAAADPASADQSLATSTPNSPQMFLPDGTPLPQVPPRRIKRADSDTPK